MTEQEAIKEVKRWTSILMSTGSKCVSDTAEAQDMAINALEKQNARKPEKEEIFRNGIDIYGFVYKEKEEVYKCSACDSVIGFAGENRYVNYCEYCGQKLDWSDEE